MQEQLGDKRLRFTDDQRRQLAAKAKGLGRKMLVELGTIVTPETLAPPADRAKIRRQQETGPRTASDGARD